MRLSSALVGAFAASVATAHPGANVEEEVLERREFLASSKHTTLDHCSAQIKARGLEKAGAIRRRSLFENQAKRGVVERALEDINKSHHSDADYGASTQPAELFAKEKSCLLRPESTEGPYYVAGEYIRRDVTEEEPGVPLTLDFAIYDVETCEPITDAWVEIWSCNSTGIYSGVPSGANFTPAPLNVDTTFLRGFQETDQSGTVQFRTLYPGHYTGRTQHIHVAVHPDASPRANKTILDNTVSHVGQLYFDQDLSAQVEAVEPYSTNTQAVTTNSQDILLPLDLVGADPFPEYVMLGEKVEDGVLAWYSFGINMTAAREISAAATYYEGGGVATPKKGE